MTRPVLLVPGIGDSGPAHWQSHWERLHPSVNRVVQRDWDQPVCAEWVRRLDQVVGDSLVAPILVGHSLGCLAIAHWAAQTRHPVHAVLMVAVPDPGGHQFPPQATGFAPLPRRLALPRLILVSSQDDPYASPSFSAECVAAWAARSIDLGARGHLNADSGLGEWAEGWRLLQPWREV